MPPPSPLPSSLARLVAGYAWERDCVGESGAAVYRLHRGHCSPDLYCKTASGLLAADVTAEAVRLEWLQGRLPVPHILWAGEDDGSAWLLTSAVGGISAYHALLEGPANRTAIVAALAHFLKRIHALPTSVCPFDASHRGRLAAAEVRLVAGLVDADDFDAERAGCSPEQVWRDMIALLPLNAERVFTHGDYSLDNLLLVDGDVAGCIDWGRAGVADPYQDLAIIWNCLGEFGPALQQHFFASYGIDEPDQARLAFHLMLDEFF